MMINNENLNFILNATDSTIGDLVKWLKFIKKNYCYISFPCTMYDGKYLNEYSFFSKEKNPPNHVNKNKKIYVGSIIKKYKNNFELWDKIRTSDELFNELILSLKSWEDNK